MKQLLLVAALLVSAMATNAQAVIRNATQCTFQYRPVCINTTTCIAAPAGGWVTVGPGGGGTVATPACPTGAELGYEVRYAAPASCQSPSYVLRMSGSPSCLSIPSAVAMPGCGGCAAGANASFSSGSIPTLVFTP